MRVQSMAHLRTDEVFGQDSGPTEDEQCQNYGKDSITESFYSIL
jgi:hypothetical protein